MRTGYFFWAKNKQNDDAIDIKELLKDHWGSTEHAFMVPSSSRPPTSPPISDREAQRPLPLESIMGIWSCGSLQTLLSVSL